MNADDYYDNEGDDVDGDDNDDVNVQGGDRMIRMMVVILCIIINMRKITKSMIIRRSSMMVMAILMPRIELITMRVLI